MMVHEIMLQYILIICVKMIPIIGRKTFLLADLLSSLLFSEASEQMTRRILPV